MHRLFRHRPSPGLVVAGIALLLALGGTGIAAVTAVPDNSVGSAQLKANAVTAAKIASNAVTNPKLASNAVTAAKIGANAVTNTKIANDAVNGAKIALNAVTSADVLDHSLTKNDFADGQLPAGPPGPQGPPGPAGPAAATGYEIVQAQTSNNSDLTKKVTANCPGSKKVIGGGDQITGDGKQNVADNGAYPDSSTSFTAEAQEVTGTPQSWALRVYAICANVS